ncbi:tetratricopeptide repeat protein [Chloroflexota bacterium]
MSDKTQTDDHGEYAGLNAPVEPPGVKALSEGPERSARDQVLEDRDVEAATPEAEDSSGEVSPFGETEPLSEAPRALPDPDRGEPLEGLSPQPKHRLGRLAGLAPAAAIVPLVLVIVAIFLWAPEWLGLSRRESQATPAAPVTAPIRTPTATGKATSKVTPGVSSGPAEFQDLLAQAEALAMQSEFEEAIAIYEMLVPEEPNDVRPEVGWAQALLLDDLADQALPHLQRALELAPGDAQVAALMARAAIETGDTRTAMRMAQLAVELDGESAAARAALAEIYLEAGQFENAAEEVRRALALDEDSAEAHRIRAQLYVASDNDLARAISELQVAADLQPGLWRRHYDLGLLLLQTEDHDQAIEALTNALVLRKKPLTYTALGKAYYGSGQYDRAGQYLEQALAAGTTDASTLALLSDIRARLGYCEDARTYYEQVLLMEPDHPLALAAREACEGNEPAPALATTPVEEPTPLPVLSGRIAFPVWNVEKSRYDTYMARTDGGDRRLAVEEMHQPAFSPDGRWLAVNGDKADYMNLCILRADGTDLREITEHLEDSLPSWSADGTALAFSSTRHRDRNSRLYVIDSVPFDGEKVQGRLLNSDLYELFGAQPAWLADGRIVYAGCDYRQVPASCGLFTISAMPGPQTPEQLTSHAGDAAPAVYGPTIVFMSDRDGNWEIYGVQNDGSGPARLTDNAAIDALPAWSPDGKTIAFVSDDGGVWAVWAMNRDGSERRKLFDIGGGGLSDNWEQERISWGP